MRESWGPWRAAAARVGLYRPPRGSSAPRAAGLTGSPAFSPLKLPFSCTSPAPRRARTAATWPPTTARSSVLGVLSGPSPPWANRRRRSARLVSAVPAKQLYEEPNCTYTYGTSFSQKVYGASYRASSSSKPPRPIPRWNRLGASYTLGKTERRRRQAESGAEAKSSGRREKNVALAEIGRRAKSVLIPVRVSKSSAAIAGQRVARAPPPTRRSAAARGQRCRGVV